MADKKLRFEVEADTTDAEKDLAKLETKVDKLEGEKVEVPITADTGELERAVADADAALKDLASQTPKVVLEVDDTALRSAAGRAKASLDDVGKSADSSKSVLANMVGNATQDLGALGGVAGSAGVAIGQMAEYMADARAAGESFGSIAGNFAKVMGPVAALSIGVEVIPRIVKAFQASAERIAKATEDMSKRVVAAQGDVDKAFKARALDEWSDNMIDRLTDVGLSFEDVAKSAKGTFTPAVQRLADVLKNVKPGDQVTPQLEAFAAALGLSTDEALRLIPTINDVAGDLETEGVALARSQEAWQDRSKFFGDAVQAQDGARDSLKGYEDGLRNVDRAALDYADSAADSARATEDTAAAAEEAAAAYEREAAAIERVNAGYDARRGAVMSQAEERVALAEAQERYNESVEDEEATVDERVVNAQKVAEGFAAVMGSIAEANGTPFDKDGAILQSLKVTAAQASGPTKAAIEEVIRALEKVPSDVNTDLTADNSQMIAEIQEAMRALAALQRAADDADAAWRRANQTGRAHTSAGVSSTNGAVNQYITVNAGFGTDAFAVRSAVLASARQTARLAQGATRFGT